MKWLFSPPSLDDLIRLLKAWRFWVLGMFAGALLGMALFYVAPPPYRARATVNVDFNLEEAWPEETDRQQFYYLERETRKLEEVAWSDDVLHVVANANGMDVTTLRRGVLLLSQPAEAGWHFYADDRDPLRAESIASTWALAFTEQAQADIAAQVSLNSFIRMDAAQVEDLPIYRSISLGTYLLASSFGVLAICMLIVLFFKPHQPAD
jgi:pimeloyl-ACP methyl ester carboxylesterase